MITDEIIDRVQLFNGQYSLTKLLEEFRKWQNQSFFIDIFQWKLKICISCILLIKICYQTEIKC